MSCQFAHRPGTNGRTGSAVTRGLWSQQPGANQSSRSDGEGALAGAGYIGICGVEGRKGPTCAGPVWVRTLSHTRCSVRWRQKVPSTGIAANRTRSQVISLARCRSWRPEPRRQEPPFLSLGSYGPRDPLRQANCVHTSSTYQVGFPTCKARASGAE